MSTDSLQLHQLGSLCQDEVDGVLHYQAGCPTQSDNHGSKPLSKTPKPNEEEPLHKVNSKPNQKQSERAHEYPVPKVCSKAGAEPGKKPVDKAQKAPARVLEKKASGLHLSRAQIKEIFREHDVDGDGFLDIGELTRAFGFLGSILPFYKAHYGMAHADADGDGLISEDELEKLIDYAEKLYTKK